MNVFSKQLGTVALAATLAVGLVPAIALAHDGEQETASVSPRPTTSPISGDKLRTGAREASETESPEASKSPRPTGSPRAEIARHNVCVKRVGEINKVMGRIQSRATDHVTHLDTLLARVETFAGTHTKPATYDALDAAAKTAGAKVTADLAALKAGGAFTCDLADPKGSVNAYKAKVKALTADLKVYRGAVKALIVAVKQAQPATGTENAQ